MRWCGGDAVVSAIVLSVLTSPAVAIAAKIPATILVDATSGQVLRESDADRSVPVGSLYQLMVLLLSCEQEELGTLRLDVPITISSLASTPKHDSSPRQRPAANAALPLHREKTYELADLLKAVAVSGADEAALAVAEAISGSAPACLEAMNARAARLGMAATHFGALGPIRPDPNSEDRTSARDIARLARALAGYGKVLEWTSLSGIPFDNGATLLRNRNPLIGAVRGVDGLHVGQTGAAVVASAMRDSLRLIAVVLDAADNTARFTAAVDLLEWGFTTFERVELVEQGERLNVSIEIDGGAQSRLTPFAGATFTVLRKHGEERNFQLRYQMPSMLTAPIDRQQEVGEIIVEESGAVLAVIPAISPVQIPAVGVVSAGLR